MMPRLPRLNRARYAFLHDVIMAAVSFPLALYLRLGEFTLILSHDYLVKGTLLFAAVAAPVFWYSRMYRGVWRYASVNDLLAITRAVTLAILIFLPLLFVITRLELVPRSLPFIQWFLMMALLGGPRFVYRVFKDRRLENVLERSDHKRVPVLLIGAGDAAELFIRHQGRDRNAPFRVVGVVDDKGTRVGRSIHGVPVLGGLEEAEHIITVRAPVRPQRLILTHERMAGATVRDLVRIVDRLGLTIARLPHLAELKTALGDGAARLQTRPVAVEDLLGRSQAVLDRNVMRALVRDRRVLVTGAGGTIGGELVRQIAALDPAALILFDNAEYQLYQIDMELAGSRPALTRHTILGDIRDRPRLDDVMTRFRPELVFHAAALKHVPLVENNPLEGVLTNTIGSRNVADASRAAGVRLMVQISTDKAVNPTSVMGATKRLAESYCQALDLALRPAGGTRFVTVRFGNVLGSTGSVVPLFQRQLAAGGPLTVTHPEMTRYFMTVREAVELVLQASADGERNPAAGGRIFVLDMGEPVKILDLARQMIRLAGLRPHEDVAIEFIGLRPGEKLYEELLHDGERLMPAASPGLFLAAPRTIDLGPLQAALNEIEAKARGRRREETLEFLCRLVPEYRVETAQAAIASG